MALDDDVVAAHLGVDPRPVLDRLDRGAHDERQERGLDAVGRRESLLTAARRCQQRVMSTSKNVETCTALSTEARRLRAMTLRIVDIGSTISSPAAGARGADGVAPVGACTARCRRGRGGRGRGRRRAAGCRSGRGRCRAAGEVLLDVLLGHAAAAAGARDLRDVEPVLGDHARDDGRHERAQVAALAVGVRCGRRSRRRGRADDRHAWKCGASAEAGGATSGAAGGPPGPLPPVPGPRRGGRSLRARAGARRGRARERRSPRRPPPPVSITAMRVPTSTVSPSATSSSRTMPVAGDGHLGVDLVGRDLDDRLVRLDGLADLLAPGDDRALGHADSHLRHDDIDERSGTHGFLPAISRRRACGRRPGRRRPAG